LVQIEACARCGGKLVIIASIEEPEVIAKILTDLEKIAPDRFQAELPLGGTLGRPTRWFQAGGDRPARYIRPVRRT